MKIYIPCMLSFTLHKPSLGYTNVSNALLWQLADGKKRWKHASCRIYSYIMYILRWRWCQDILFYLFIQITMSAGCKELKVDIFAFSESIINDENTQTNFMNIYNCLRSCPVKRRNLFHAPIIFHLPFWWILSGTTHFAIERYMLDLRIYN